MKAMMIGSFAATLIVFQGVAQRGENDDMYFNSKDREKLSVTAAANDKIDSDYKAFKKKHFDESKEITETTNPTDSYSARNINPEYISRSNSEQASEDEQNYYLEGYKPNTYDSYSAGGYTYYNDSLNSNNNFNYNNNLYGSSSMYGANSYNSYCGYCDPWMSPYYSGGSGMMISLSYMWGNGGYYNPYRNPYGYYNPYSYYPSGYGYSPYNSGYGYPSYYGPSYYGSSEPSGINYGKRPSRHSAIVQPMPRSSQNISSTTTTSGSVNGRSRKTDDEYYVKPSRRVSSFENTSESRDSYTRPTDYLRTRESSNSSRESRPTYSPPSRSSSSPSPSRSSGSSGSRSRGRD